MANTFELIASSTVGAGGASSIDFTSIPSTYTDLVLKVSARGSAGGPNGLFIAFNGSTSNFTGKYLQGAGTGTPSSSSLARYIGTEVAPTFTANTFGNAEVYIPNYASSNNKSFSADAVSENNATEAYATLAAGLWSITTAINQVTLTISSGSSNFVQYSTAYLYGVKNA